MILNFIKHVLRIHTPSKHLLGTCWCQKNWCAYGGPASAACYVVSACGCKTPNGGWPRIK